MWYNEHRIGKDILLMQGYDTMPDFKVDAPFQPTGDQPEAIAQLAKGLQKGYKKQTLLGVTGSGKTYTVAKIVEIVQKPTLVLAPNKTLAAQLYSEYKEFFPNNAVEYFVSYYDYYQPEAYIPRTDTYVEKESMVNEEIEKLRLSTTRSLFERRDVLIVASVYAVTYWKSSLPMKMSPRAASFLAMRSSARPRSIPLPAKSLVNDNAWT